MSDQSINATAFAAAAGAMEIALGAQLIGWHLILEKLIATGCLTHDHAAEVTEQLSIILRSPHAETSEHQIAGPVFEVLARHAVALKEHAAKFALAGAPTSGAQ